VRRVACGVQRKAAPNNACRRVGAVRTAGMQGRGSGVEKAEPTRKGSVGNGRQSSKVSSVSREKVMENQENQAGRWGW